ncbi:MAG: hypothetical protein ABL886_17745, partial [Rhodoglobus sp.]
MFPTSATSGCRASRPTNLDRVRETFPPTIAASSRPVQEKALLASLFASALDSVGRVAVGIPTAVGASNSEECDPGQFCGPSIAEFFPEPVLFIGTPFEMNRILIIRMLVVVVLLIIFWVATRN